MANEASIVKSTLLLACLATSGLGSTACADAEEKKAMTREVGTTGYAQERHRAPPAYEGPPRSGEQVYEYRCKSCHARTTQGAPLPDDSYEWSRRARQGMDVLMDHVIKGYQRGLMPARGGCLNCSDAELRAAVMYMLEESGVAAGGAQPEPAED